MILERVKYFNLLVHDSIAVTLLVSTRDHGTEQTKSTEVIQNIQYVPQPSVTEEIHEKTPCGNHLFPTAKYERKQPCPLTQSNTLWKRNTLIEGEVRETKKHKQIHPTMQNIVRSKLISRRCVKIRHIYIDSFLVYANDSRPFLLLLLNTLLFVTCMYSVDIC